MAIATLTINVSAGDLAKLKDLPAQIQTIVTQAKQLLDSIRSGGNPENALSGLLGNLSNLAGEAKQVPELGELLHPIQELLSKLPAGAMGDLKAIVHAIEEVLAFFGPLKDVLLSGHIEEVFKQAVDKVFDQAGKLFQPNDEVRSAQAGLEEFLSLFRTMIGWRNSAPQPHEVVDLLSRAIIGIPHNLLEDAANRLESALTPLSFILPAGPDLTRWQGAPAARLAFWQGINGRFSSNAAIDWPRLEADLQAELHLLLDIRTTRDRLLSVTLGNLNRINFHGLDAVHQAMLAIPNVNPPRLSSFTDGIKQHMQGIVSYFDTWQPTPDELRATVRAFIDSISDFIAASPLGQIRALLVDFQHRLLLAIESLPFRGLAREVEDKLREIAKALNVLDHNIICKPVHEFFQKIEDKLHQFSADTIKNAIQQLWKGVEDALKQVQQLLETVRTTIQGAIASLQNMIQQARPALAQVSQAVASIKTTLDSFDLSQPASAVIDELHQLKGTVATLDFSSLPGPAVSALHAGADALRSINLTAAVNPPLNGALAKIDPTPIMQHAADAIEDVTGKLKLLDPATIVQTLDAPINELLKALSNFGPDQLQKLLHDAMKPVEDAIRGLDIERFFAPLTHLFADLTAKVDAVLNPDVIFHPIEAAFQPLIDIIDKLEPTNLVHMVDPHADAASGHMRGGVAPPSPIASAGGLLKDALQPVIQQEDELFGFRPGDMLTPVIDLHHQIAQAFEHLDDSVLEPAAHLLRDALHGRMQSLNPANLQLRITDALRNVHAEFDFVTVSNRLRDAEDAYHNAVIAIANAAQQPLSPSDAPVAARVVATVADLDPLNLVPSPSDSSGVLNACVNVEAHLDLSGIRAGFGTLNDLQAILPAFLTVANVTAGSVRQAIHDLDPAPVRIEINNIFDQLGHKIVGLQSAFLAALEEFFLAVENFLIPVTPGSVIQLASRLHAALKDQLLAFSPATFKDEVKLIFDVVKNPLTAFDPSIIVNELNGPRDQLIQRVEGLVAGLLPDPAPFNALIAELAQFKPSAILAPITQALQPLSQLIALLDVKVLLQPLIDAIARIRGEIPKVIADIEAALDDVLSAFPEGGPASVSVSASASIN
jgi:hypothetical protein